MERIRDKYIYLGDTGIPHTYWVVSKDFILGLIGLTGLILFFYVLYLMWKKEVKPYNKG